MIVAVVSSLFPVLLLKCDTGEKMNRTPKNIGKMKQINKLTRNTKGATCETVRMLQCNNWKTIIITKRDSQWICTMYLRSPLDVEIASHPVAYMTIMSTSTKWSRVRVF